MLRNCESSSFVEPLNHPPTKRSSEAFTSAEYVILSDIVSSLGTYSVNRSNSSLASSRNKQKATAEAELLLNFISKASEAIVSESDTAHSNSLDDSSTIPSDSSIEESFPNYISPSLSFESNKIVLDVNDTSSNVKDNDTSKVSISSLILQPQMNPSFSFTTISIPSLTDQVFSILPEGISAFPYHPTRSAENIISQEGSSSVSNAIAESIIASVNAAMECRVKTWIKTLSKRVALDYESRVNEVKKAFVNGSTNHKSLQSGLLEIKDLLKASTEARVINALTHVASVASVHDIRTTFHILEQCQDTCTADVLHQMPRAKKIKPVSDESKSTANDDSSIHLAHVVLLDIKCTVIADTFKSISFNVATPGEIHGSFTRVNGESHVNDIIVNLDTNVLANAIEKECRRIICSYAQESMAGQHFIYCTIHDTIQSQFMQGGTFVAASIASVDETETVFEALPKEDDTGNTQGAKAINEDRITPKLETSENIVLAPKPSEAIMVTPIASGGPHSDVSTKVMPPPPPRLPLDGNTHPRSSMFLHPRRISPSADSNPAIDSISMTPPRTSPYMKSSSFMGSRTAITNGHPIRPAPSLVSPYKEMLKGRYPVFNNNMQRPILPPLSNFSFSVDSSTLRRRD